jgi:hypothetical protein
MLTKIGEFLKKQWSGLLMLATLTLGLCWWLAKMGVSDRRQALVVSILWVIAACLWVVERVRLVKAQKAFVTRGDIKDAIAKALGSDEVKKALRDSGVLTHIHEEQATKEDLHVLRRGFEDRIGDPNGGMNTQVAELHKRAEDLWKHLRHLTASAQDLGDAVQQDFVVSLDAVTETLNWLSDVEQKKPVTDGRRMEVMEKIASRKRPRREAIDKACALLHMIEGRELPAAGVE